MITLNPRSFLWVIFWLQVVPQVVGCASFPTPRKSKHTFPEKDVYLELPSGKDQDRPFETLGWVRTRATFPTLQIEEHTDPVNCQNYFNKAAGQLLTEAKKVGADAVIQVRSVVFLIDGKSEEHRTPECSDSGAEGEILLKGIAIRYRPMNHK